MTAVRHHPICRIYLPDAGIRLLGAESGRDERSAMTRASFYRSGFDGGLVAYSESSRDFRQRRKARRRCFTVLGFVRLSIQEPLALRSGDEGFGAFGIGQLAGVCSEIELGEVARQVRFADMVKGAIHATL